MKNKKVTYAIMFIAVLIIIALVIRFLNPKSTDDDKPQDVTDQNVDDTSKDTTDNDDSDATDENSDDVDEANLILPEDIIVTTPSLNDSQDTALFKISNLSTIDFNGIVHIQPNGDSSSTEEYPIVVKAGTEKEQIKLTAGKGDIISMVDNEGNTFLEPYELGSRVWVGTWASAQQGLDSRRGEYPPAPGLHYNTLRQVVRISVGGNQLRLTFSNEYGRSPLEINSVHISRHYEQAKSIIFPAYDTPVTFNGGSESVIIPAGQVATSDVIDFEARDLERIAISTYFGAVPEIITSHTGSRTTSYLATGNQVSEAGLPDALKFDFWYFISQMDILTSPKNKAIVALGDSTTDGRGVRNNYDDRWTDILAERLLENESTRHISVLNQGIGGNSIFGGLGPAAYKRFGRDVLEQPGVAYAIVFEGINDIGYTTSLGLVDQIIDKYKSFADQAHAKGIKIYGATITPFGEFKDYYSDEHGELREQIRQEINAWIRDNEYFDGVIDFDEALRDKDNPKILAKEYSSDGLHPNVAGYEKIGQVIDLTIFED